MRPPLRPSASTRARVAVASLLLLVAAGIAAGCGAGDPAPQHAGAPPAAVDRHAAEPPPVLGPKVFPLEAAPLLDGPGRDAWQKPDAVMEALGLRPGDRVADVGCGTGYFALRFLDAVGERGHVLAIDIQQGMLDRLAARLPDGAASRVTLRCSDPARPVEGSDALDVVFCANTLKEVPDEQAAAFVASMAAGLVPGGRLVVVDWLPQRMRLGPPLAHRIAPARIRELAVAAGLVPTEDLDVLPTHAFLVFTRPE